MSNEQEQQQRSPGSGYKQVFAEAALAHYGIPSVQNLPSLVEEAKLKLLERTRATPSARPKFVLAGEGSNIQPYRHKPFFVQNLLEQLGVEIDHSKVEESSQAAVEVLREKMGVESAGVRPRLLVVT